jgi:hypothetical protein
MSVFIGDVPLKHQIVVLPTYYRNGLYICRLGSCSLTNDNAFFFGLNLNNAEAKACSKIV